MSPFANLCRLTRRRYKPHMRHALLVVLLAFGGCKKSSDTKEPKSDVKPKAGLMVGLVTDIGGRGDQSFNDSALRGLEV